MTIALESGRSSFEKKLWEQAFGRLAEADQASVLGADDLERLARAADLSGRPEESAEAWAKAYREWLRGDERLRAARCAFWLGMGLMQRGEFARGGGWFARANALVEAHGEDCPERGYLYLPIGLQNLGEGNGAAANAAFSEAYAIGQRFAEMDLLTLSRLGRGRSLIALDRAAEGVGFLDEAMLAVTAGETSATVAGIVYCAVIGACQEIFDLRRAAEWTAALSRWCGSQPELVPFRGECLVHRSEVMQLHGEWDEALEEARGACQRLSQPPPSEGTGAAYYQRAEIHRLLGEFAEAEESYRLASRWGRQPELGHAQLRLAQGQVDAAAASSRLALEEAPGRVARTRLLAPYVEIMLATGDLAAARAAAEELAATAEELGADSLSAAAAYARGAVLRAEGDPRSALTSLRRAWALWHQLDAPYEGARTRALIGLACRELGDRDTAEMELDAARWVFQELGAATDLAALDALTADNAADNAAAGLTARETEVLRLVATGRTNRAIASELVISEKTVARHISNIFTKLGLPSRAAATAYAYEHGLV